MLDEKEGAVLVAEGSGDAPKAEQVETPSPSAETPSKEASATPETPQAKSYSQDEYEAAISEAEARVQAAKDKELSEWRQRADAAERAAAERELKAQEAQETESWGDTAEVRNFQAERRRQIQINADLMRRTAEVDVKEKGLNQTVRQVWATNLAEEYGLKPEELAKAESPAAMRDLARDLAIKARDKKIKELQNPPQDVHKEKPGAFAPAGPTSEDERLKQRYPSMYPSK